jgi:hypothetical protein
MIREAQILLLDDAINQINKIKNLYLLAEHERIKEFKFHYAEFSDIIRILPWDDFQIKDFNRDIPWDNLVNLDKFINLPDVPPSTIEKLLLSKDFSELHTRLSKISEKEKAILKIENPTNDKERWIRDLYAFIKKDHTYEKIPLYFDSREKEPTGLPELRSIADYACDANMLTIIEEALKKLTDINISEKAGREAFLCLLLKVGEAIKFLSDSSKAMTTKIEYDQISNARDAVRHAPDKSFTMSVLDNLISEGSLLTAIYKDFFDNIFPEFSRLHLNLQDLKRRDMHFRPPNNPVYKPATTPSIDTTTLDEDKKIYLSISQEPGDIKEMKGEVVIDLLSDKILIPFSSQDKKKFGENIKEKVGDVVNMAIEIAKQRIKPSDTKDERNAIITTSRVKVKPLAERIKNITSISPIPSRSTAVSAIVPTSLINFVDQLVSAKADSSTKKESYGISQLRGTCFYIERIDALLKVAGIDMNHETYITGSEKLMRKPMLNEAVNFNLIILSEYIRCLANRDDLADLLTTNDLDMLDKVRHIGNGVAHLDEKGRGMTSNEAAMYAVEKLYPALKKALSTYDAADAAAKKPPVVSLATSRHTMFGAGSSAKSSSSATSKLSSSPAPLKKRT